MSRTLLSAALASAALLFATAPAAQAADPVIAVDVIADHDVVWDVKSSEAPDHCKTWSTGSGTQSIRIRTGRRQLVYLERAFGSVLLSGKRAGTYEGTVDRIGRWKVNVPAFTADCFGCGPLSELGQCDPNPEKPKPLQFKCGDVPLRSAAFSVSFRETGGIPSLLKGLDAVPVFRKDRYFSNCPPTMPKGVANAPRLQAEWPELEHLPQKDTDRIVRLQPGDSVVAEVERQRSYVDDGRKITKGDSCIKAPDIKDGYTECAKTSYMVTFTRIS